MFAKVLNHIAMEHDARLSGDLGNIVKRLQNTRFTLRFGVVPQICVH